MASAGTTDDVAQAAESAGSLRPAPESLLGVDIGTAFTKAALFEPVEGQYRLVARGQARTTSGTHVFDGLAKACAEIEELTGRQLFRGGEPLAGDASGARGVEILGAVVSCYRPLLVLATNDQAFGAARSERCLVTLLSETGLQERLDRLTSASWDAIVGTADELAAATALLGQAGSDGSTERTSTMPALISGEASAIRSGLAEIALKLAYQDLPGLHDLASASTERLTTVPAALLGLAKLIASRFGLRLGLADCGASQASVAFASPDTEWLRLAPFDRAYVDMPVNPVALRDLHVWQQRALAQCVDDSFAADLLMGTGAIKHFKSWSEPALTLLNGVHPSGVIQFALDSAGIATQIAPFAPSLPDVASRIFEHDALTGLGAAVCPRGTVKPGAKAIEVRWRVDDQNEQSRAVTAGELVRIPLTAGSKASLSLFPAKSLDIGLKRPGVAAKAHIDGGHVGLIVDARVEADDTAEGRRRWEEALA